MKKIILGLVLIVVLFLAGCGDDDEGGAQVGSVFEGGSQGIVASFEPFGIQEEGVYVIYDTENFPIEVNVKNKGEEDIAAGDLVVKLKGINLNDFENIPAAIKSNERMIEKVSEFNREGGEEIIDFTPLSEAAKYKHSITGFYQPDIFATIEYKYKTRVIVPKVCFKEDLNDESVCDVKESKDVFVSGAPILVKSVKEDSAGRGVMILTFEIENAGGGKVTKVGEAFDLRYGQLAFNMKTDPGMWECRSAGKINEARLIDGKATVICRLKEALPAGTLYTKQIELELSYVYRSVMSESIRIKESLS
ncbi:MAG: hypothetical protein KAT77_02335 [Nanoarchaeota archaeon]|nr:hypothetical protein [Nanoarchaeota archaeon]